RAVGFLQHVIEKSVFFIPQSHPVVAAMAHSVGNVDKVLPELAGYVLVGGVILRQLHRHGQQVECVHRHPAGSVGLLDVSTSGQGSAAVKDTNVVQAKESALENVHALGIFAVDPPGEIQQKFVKHA